MQTVVINFSRYLEELGYSRGSCYQLPACVREFLEVTNKEVEQVEPKDIQDFVRYLENRPLKRRIGLLSESMIRHYIVSIRTFFNWLETTGQITSNPISSLKFKRGKSSSREPLEESQIATLFRAAETLKEKAVLHLFYSCGLRRMEAERLNVRDLHIATSLLYVRQGKGGKRRAIPLTSKVKHELEAYLNCERETTTNEAFMINKNGKRMRGGSFLKVLKELLKRSGLGEDVSLHHLRHSIATHLLQRGVGMEFVRDFLGHGHLETTQIYAKVERKKMIEL